MTKPVVIFSFMLLHHYWSQCKKIAVIYDHVNKLSLNKTGVSYFGILNPGNTSSGRLILQLLEFYHSR